MAADPIAIAEATERLVEVLAEWGSLDGRYPVRRWEDPDHVPWGLVYASVSAALDGLYLALRLDRQPSQAARGMEGWPWDLMSLVEKLEKYYFVISNNLVDWHFDESNPNAIPGWRALAFPHEMIRAMQWCGDFLRACGDDFGAKGQVLPPAPEMPGTVSPAPKHRLEIIMHGSSGDGAPEIALDGQRAHLPEFIARVIAVVAEAGDFLSYKEIQQKDPALARPAKLDRRVRDALGEGSGLRKLVESILSIRQGIGVGLAPGVEAAWLRRNAELPSR